MDKKEINSPKLTANFLFWICGVGGVLVFGDRGTATLDLSTDELQITTDEISDEQSLFGPGSLGFDSVDALQLVVALDKKYGLKIPDPESARAVLQNVRTIAEAVAKHLASAPAERRPSSE